MTLRLLICETPMSGAMLNLELPADMHERLGVEKPAKPMHVTLMYLGKAAKITPQLAEALIIGATRALEAHGPLTGTIGASLGSFPAGADGMVPHWASVELDGIQELRADLKRQVIAAGFPFTDSYPTYNPHVTICFAPEGESGPTHCQAADVTCDRVDLAYGPDARAAFAAATRRK